MGKVKEPEREGPLDPGYWAVIPAEVRYDPDLSSTAKLLYAEISALCRREGYCWARSVYFEEMFGITASTVGRILKQLEQRGHIWTEWVVTEKGRARHIHISPNRADTPETGDGRKNADTPRGIPAKMPTPPGGIGKNAEGGVRKNADTHNVDNNTSKHLTPPNPPKGGKPPKRDNPQEPDWRPERFEAFWKFYPRDYRGSKQKARNAWNKLKPQGAVMRAIANALQRHMKGERWREGVGIPNASTFLNPANEYWDMEDAERPAEPSRPTDGPGTVVESRYEKL